MKIEYKELKGLPSLAWCAIMTKGEEVMKALVGRMVECREDGFESGIWDGEFEKQDFHTATYGCLTGCKSTEWGGGIYHSNSHAGVSVCGKEER